MKNLKIYVLIFIMICFVSCKDETELGNDFFYLPEYESIDVGYPYGTIVYHSNEKNIYDDILVYSDIVGINNNDKYIIVKQKPNKKTLLKVIEDNLNLWNNFYIESNKDSLINLVNRKILISDIHKLIKDKNIKEVEDSIFNNDLYYKELFNNKINYYIIQKRDNSILGPLSFKKFEIFKKERSIDLDFEN